MIEHEVYVAMTARAYSFRQRANTDTALARHLPEYSLQRCGIDQTRKIAMSRMMKQNASPIVQPKLGLQSGLDMLEPATH